MVTDMSGIDSENLYEDLLLLRKGAGFVQRRISERSALALLLTEGRAESFEKMLHRFRSAIHALTPAEAALLSDIYGVSEQTTGLTTLKTRREVHGAQIGRGVDTVASREPDAIRHLLDRLLRGTYAQSPLTIDVPEMHDGIVYDSVSYAMLVKDRAWVYTREFYSFTAEFEEMDFVTISRSFAAKVTPHRSMRFRVNSRETSKGFNDHFWSRNAAMDADEPMRRGNSYQLRFQLEPPAEQAATPLSQLTRALHARALLASFKVRFEGETPAKIWKVDRVSFFNNPGHPYEGNIIELENSKAVTLRLRDFHSGLFAGIAWEWE